MKDEKFSAFIDDELSLAEFDEMYSTLTTGTASENRDMIQKWQRYHIISDTLQKHLSEKVDVNLADRVMSELENEPVILAPNRSHINRVSPISFPIFKQIAGLAVAASVMVVAILVSQSFKTNDGADLSAPLAKLPTMPSKEKFARVAEPQTALAAQTALTAQTALAGQTALTNQQTTLPPSFQNQLNKYLANHNQYASGVSGVLPYARIIGYTPESPQLSHSKGSE